MNIQETTKQALSELFADHGSADQAAEAEVEVQVGKEAETAEEDGKKDLPRANGIIEQDYRKKGFHLDVQISRDQLVRAVQILFEQDYFLESITGVDWIKEEQLETVYDFSRYDFNLCRVVIRVRTMRTDPHLPTITGIYTGANWHERETHDFFGIIFDGHPHLIPLLLPEDADFHPLLKDFKA